MICFILIDLQQIILHSNFTESIFLDKGFNVSVNLELFKVFENI